MTFEIYAFAGLAIVAYIFTRIWQHWIDNPDEYEKLHQERLRRLIRRMGRDRKRRKDKEEETPKE